MSEKEIEYRKATSKPIDVDNVVNARDRFRDIPSEEDTSEFVLPDLTLIKIKGGNVYGDSEDNRPHPLNIGDRILQSDFPEKNPRLVRAAPVLGLAALAGTVIIQQLAK